MHFTGPSSAPTDLNITSYNDSTTLMVWGPPLDAQSPSLLSYAVVIRNGSGAPVYSETVREPQLVITTPDSCGHYEATVTLMCGRLRPVLWSWKVSLKRWHGCLYVTFYINALSFICCDENSMRIFEQFCWFGYMFLNHLNYNAFIVIRICKSSFLVLNST